MTKPSEIYNPYDVVIIPFPYTDVTGQPKRRPAVVLSDKTGFDLPTGQLICAMITSGKALKWPHAIPMTDLQSAGLDKPCVIRMKIFTIDARLILRRAGAIGKHDRQTLMRPLKAALRVS